MYKGKKWEKLMLWLGAIELMAKAISTAQGLKTIEGGVKAEHLASLPTLQSHFLALHHPLETIHNS